MRRGWLVALILIISSLAFAQGKRPFTFEDMMALKRVSEPQISPDGKWVAFSAVDVNLAANTRTPHLWVIPLAGGEARQLTSGQAGEDRPRWSPDGKRLAFISSREGGSQVWVQDFDSAAGNLTGEPRKFTSISTEADGEIWSPDGRSILFVSSVYPDCKDDACNKFREEAKATSKVKASIFTRLFYRHWASFTGGKRSHLFLVPTEGGAARDLTPGDHDVPPFQLGGADLYSFSPDSQEVAFTSNIDEVEATSTNNDLFVVPVTGGTPRKITTNPASDSTPRYSPDGKSIAYLAQFRPGYESDRFRLMLYDRKAGTHKNLTECFDRWVGSFVWASDSKLIYFAAEDHGESPVYVMPADTGFCGANAQRTVGREAKPPAPKAGMLMRGHNDDLAITPDDQTLLFTRMSVRAPNEIWTVNPKPECDGIDVGGVSTPPIRNVSCQQPPARPLTHLNDAVLSQVEMPPLESFVVTGAEKTRVEGFLIKPSNFNPQQKYPVKFLIHGGPQGAWG